jgi:hypothetical protein
MSHAKLAAVPDLSVPLTWKQICERHPDEWVALVEKEVSLALDTAASSSTTRSVGCVTIHQPPGPPRPLPDGQGIEAAITRRRRRRREPRPWVLNARRHRSGDHNLFQLGTSSCTKCSTPEGIEAAI